MKFQTYKATPGLERFPERERFGIYRATHERLMLDDPGYRKQSRRYMTLLTCLALVPAVAALSAPALGRMVAGVLIGASITAILFLAFQQQRTMNRCVGAALPPNGRSTQP